jgi:hypothetical protein
MAMYRTILGYETEQRRVAIDDDLRHCILESGCSEGTLAVHALQGGDRLAVEAETSGGGARQSPWLLVEFWRGELLLPRGQRIVLQRGAGHASRLLVKAWPASPELRLAEVAPWECVFTRMIPAL